MDRPYANTQVKKPSVKVTGWVCMACQMSGEFVPALDMDAFRLEDALHAVVVEHFDRTSKEARHGAAIQVRL